MKSCSPIIITFVKVGVRLDLETLDPLEIAHGSELKEILGDVGMSISPLCQSLVLINLKVM